MSGERWVLLVWSCASLAPWLAIWIARPGLRDAMRWSSWFAVPFGFSELMFAGRYWSPPGALRSRPLRNLAFATPGLAFALGLLLLRTPIAAGVVAMFAGAAARAIARRDLAAKVALGALVFGAYYALLVGSLVWLEPGYVASVWSRTGWPGARFHGFPIVELAFGLSFGAYWSGLWEQYRWTFEPRRALYADPAE